MLSCVFRILRSCYRDTSTPYNFHTRMTHESNRNRPVNLGVVPNSPVKVTPDILLQSPSDLLVQSKESEDPPCLSSLKSKTIRSRERTSFSRHHNSRSRTTCTRSSMSSYPPPPTPLFPWFSTLREEIRHLTKVRERQCLEKRSGLGTQLEPTQRSQSGEGRPTDPPNPTLRTDPGSERNTSIFVTNESRQSRNDVTTVSTKKEIFKKVIDEDRKLRLGE